MSKNKIVIAHLKHEITISCIQDGLRTVEIKNESGEIVYIFSSFLSHDTALGYGCGFVDGYVKSTKDRQIKDGKCLE